MKKTFILYILAIALVLVLSGCLPKKRGENIKTSSFLGDRNQEIGNDENLAKEDNLATADWQVYVNPKYSYTIKYPKDWYFYKNGINPPPTGVLLANKPEGSTTPGGYANVDVFVDEALGRTLDDYEEIKSREKSGDKKTNIAVDGKEAVRLIDEGNYYNFHVGIYVAYKNFIYHFRWQAPKDDEELQKVCEQILATISFN